MVCDNWAKLMSSKKHNNHTLFVKTTVYILCLSPWQVTIGSVTVSNVVTTITEAHLGWRVAVTPVTKTQTPNLTNPVSVHFMPLAKLNTLYLDLLILSTVAKLYSLDSPLFLSAVVKLNTFIL